MSLRTLLFLSLLASPPSAQFFINEVRVDQPSIDDDEYFELVGSPGASLSGVWYVTLGDGCCGSGTVEEALDLSPYSISLSGFFVAAESTFTLGAADLTTTLAFENSDNVTHMLVTGFTGSVGDDLDTNDDGVLETRPWASILDLVAIVESPNPPVSTEYHYGPPNVGPIGSSVPEHVYKVLDPTGTIWTWQVGSDTVGVDDTPGAPNGVSRVSAANGGTVGMALAPNAVSVAGSLHFVAGSISGASPGFPYQGLTIPLNPDAYTILTLVQPNTIIQNSFGPYVGAGLGIVEQADLVFPAGLPLAGLTLSHAYVVLDATTLAIVWVGGALPTTIDP